MMSLPAVPAPIPTALAASSAVLDFPLDAILATIGGLAILTIGLAVATALRVTRRPSRHTRTLPTSAAA